MERCHLDPSSLQGKRRSLHKLRAIQEDTPEVNIATSAGDLDTRGRRQPDHKPQIEEFRKQSKDEGPTKRNKQDHHTDRWSHGNKLENEKGQEDKFWMERPRELRMAEKEASTPPEEEPEVIELPHSPPPITRVSKRTEKLLGYMETASLPAAAIVDLLCNKGKVDPTKPQPWKSIVHRPTSNYDGTSPYVVYCVGIISLFCSLVCTNASFSKKITESRFLSVSALCSLCHHTLQEVSA